MYTISVRWSDDVHERVTYTDVVEYDVSKGVLRLTFDDHHQLLLPLFQVTAVDIVEAEA